MPAKTERQIWNNFVSIFFLCVLILAGFIGWPYFKRVTSQTENIPPEVEGELAIELSKYNYEAGEPVSFIITNNYSVPIYYAKRVECGASFYEIKNNLNFTVPYYPSCLWDTYKYEFTKLRPGEVLRGYWNQTQRQDKYILKQAAGGYYKIVFPYTFAENQPEEQGWEEGKRQLTSAKFHLLR